MRKIPLFKIRLWQSASAHSILCASTCYPINTLLCWTPARKPLVGSFPALSLPPHWPRVPWVHCQFSQVFACRKALGFAELSLGQEINVVINANIFAEASLMGLNQNRWSSYFFTFENITPSPPLLSFPLSLPPFSLSPNPQPACCWVGRAGTHWLRERDKEKGEGPMEKKWQWEDRGRKNSSLICTRQWEKSSMI